MEIEEKMMLERNCDRCGEAFEPRRSDQRFCCRACKDDWFLAEHWAAVEAYRLSNTYHERALARAKLGARSGAARTGLWDRRFRR
jgi:ribosomal protein S27AE